MRGEIPPPADPSAPLAERARDLIASYDAETKDYAFGDGGGAEMYANWLADLLEEILGKTLDTG